jgi:hypothetical protein
MPATIKAVLLSASPNRRGGQPGERVEQGDDHRHVRAADRQHRGHAECRGGEKQHDHQQFRVTADGDRHATAQRDEKQHRVQRLLQGAEGDRAAGDELLKLAERDVGAPERNGPDERGEQRRDHDIDELVRIAARVAELHPCDQRDGAAADPVEQGDHLRHRGHLDLGLPGLAGGQRRNERGTGGRRHHRRHNGHRPAAERAVRPDAVAGHHQIRDPHCGDQAEQGAAGPQCPVHGQRGRVKPQRL